MKNNPTTPSTGKNTGSLNANDEGFNGNYTAIPKDIERASDASADADLRATPVDFGEMNERDAKESGYTDEDGEAVDLAKKDVEGSPTGALTDVGRGRSSAVKKH